MLTLDYPITPMSCVYIWFIHSTNTMIWGLIWITLSILVSPTSH